MKLGERRFRQRLRIAVRSTIWTNLVWTKEWRRARTQLRPAWPRWFVRFLFSAIALSVISIHDDPYTLLVGGGAWWLIAVVLFKTGELMGSSLQGPGFVHALAYPMPHEPQWRFVRRKLVTSAVLVAAEFGTALVLATELRSDLRVWLLAPLFGLTQAGTLVLLAIVAHRILPARFVRRVMNASVAAGATMILTVVMAAPIPFVREQVFQRAAAVLEKFTPAGFISRFFLNAATEPSLAQVTSAVGLAIVCVALAATAMFLLHGRMLSAFRAQEESFCRDGTLAGLETETKASKTADQKTVAGESGAAGHVSSETIDRVAAHLRSALAQTPGPRRRDNSWWTRTLEHILDHKSIAAAEHLWPKWPRPDRWWLVALVVVVLAPSVGATFSHRGGNMRPLGLFIAGAVVLFGTVPLRTEKLRMRTPALIGARFAPWLAFHPIGYSEISRVVFRLEIPRALASWPLIVMLAISGWDEMEATIEQRASFAIVAMATAIAIQPLRAANAFSPLNGNGMRLRQLAFGVAFGFLLITTFGGACALAAHTGIAGAFAGAAMIDVTAFLVWFAYREAHNRCWWDLVSPRGN